MPSSASIVGSSLWLPTDVEDRIDTMRACRPALVAAEVMPRLPPAPVLARASLRSSLALVFGSSSRLLQQPRQQRLLGMQPVLRLIPHGALRSVDHLVSDFVSTVRRKAVQHNRIPLRPSE